MSEQSNYLDVEYDFVAIIDGIPICERQGFNLGQELIEFLAKKGLPQEKADCPNPTSAIFFKKARFLSDL